MRKGAVLSALLTWNTEKLWSIQYITGNAWEAGIIILEAIFLMEYVICLYLHFVLVNYYSCLSAIGSSSGFCFICAINGKIFDITPCRINYIEYVHLSPGTVPIFLNKWSQGKSRNNNSNNGADSSHDR